MGYYNSSESKKKRTGYFASSFSGLIAGALLVGVVVPQFTDVDAAAENQPRTVETASGIQNVSDIVTTDVTEIVDATSAAVVGVTNLKTAQQKSVHAGCWSRSAGSGYGVWCHL
nr:hypothetical protein [Planococcus glaciei]